MWLMKLNADIFLNPQYNAPENKVSWRAVTYILIFDILLFFQVQLFLFHTPIHAGWNLAAAAWWIWRRRQRSAAASNTVFFNISFRNFGNIILYDKKLQLNCLKKLSFRSDFGAYLKSGFGGKNLIAFGGQNAKFLPKIWRFGHQRRPKNFFPNPLFK